MDPSALLPGRGCWYGRSASVRRRWLFEDIEYLLCAIFLVAPLSGNFLEYTVIDKGRNGPVSSGLLDIELSESFCMPA